jgi:hypothetical protein
MDIQQQRYILINKNYGQGHNLKGIYFKVIFFNGLCFDEVMVDGS